MYFNHTILNYVVFRYMEQQNLSINIESLAISFNIILADWIQFGVS